MRFSVSQIGLYKNCPFQYYARYFLGLEQEESEALEFGKLFHSSISEIIKQKKLVLTGDKVLDEMLKVLFPYLPLKEDLNTETKHQIDLDGIPFTVILDADNENNILEFKSASKKWDEEKFKTEIQPHVYMKNEFIRTGKWKTFTYFIVGKSDKPFIQIKQIEYDKTIWEDCKSVCEQIQKDFEFLPKQYKLKNNSCFFCGYSDSCPAKF